MTAVQNKIPDISHLVIKTDYDAEILCIKSKYFTTADYNRFTNENLDLKNKQKGVAVFLCYFYIILLLYLIFFFLCFFDNK